METVIKSQSVCRCLAVLHDMHRTASIWFGYLVSASVAIKAYGADITPYISARAQLWVMGLAAGALFVDKIRRSIGATVPDPVIPPPPLP